MRTQRIGGYTLIELITVLAIAAILTQLSIGGMQTLVSKTHNNIALQTAITSLDRARSLAVMRGKRVGVCMLNSTDSSCSEDWKGQEIAVFIDENRNRQRDVDEEILYRQPWPDKNIKMEWSNWRHEPLITYEPTGAVVSNGTLSFLDAQNHQVQALIISKPGRARIQSY